MDNMLAIETRYRDHLRDAAYLHEESWKFARPAKRHSVRAAAATFLVALATLLAPQPKQETQAA